MKLKYLSMAFAAVALASCSSDDLTLSEAIEDQLGENQVFAYIADDDADLTRAGFATFYNTENNKIKQQAVFEKGDIVKVYKTNTWKPQLLKFNKYATISGVNGSVFDWAVTDDPATENVNEGKYNDGTNANDMTNREYAVYPQTLFSFDNENRANLEFELPAENNLNLDGKYVSSKTTDIEGKEDYKIFRTVLPLFGFANQETNEIKFNYMTSLVRVYLEGVSAGEHKIILESESQKLNGTFQAGNFDAADYVATKDIPTFNTEATANEAERQTVFNFKTTVAESDYVIFLPLPTGEYDLSKLHIMFDYTPKTATQFEAVQGNAGYDYTNYAAYLAGQNPEKVAARFGNDNFTLAATWASGDNAGKYIKVSDCINDEANKQDSKTQNIGRGIKFLAEKKQAIEQNVGDLSMLNELVAIYANYGRSVLANINLTSDITVYNPESSLYTDNGKKLNIPALQNDVTLHIKGGHNFVDNVLKIVDAEGANVTSPKTLTIIFDDVDVPNGIEYTASQNIVIETANDGTVGTDGTKPLTINNQNVDATIGSGILGFTLTKAKSLTLSADPGLDINVKAIPVTIKAGVPDNTITTEGGAVTVASTAGTIKEIKLAKAATLTINGGAITTLTLPIDANQTVTMNGGSIGTVAAGALTAPRAVTFNTYGDAVIGTVNNTLDATNKYTYTFNAHWNKATKDAEAIAEANNKKEIYTALQLKSVKNGVDGNKFELNANVIIDSDFESIDLKANVTEFSAIAGVSISGLTAPLFTTLSNAALDITGLSLTGVNITDTGLTGVGAIAKTTSGTNITIKNTSVAGSINSQYYTGGFVGKVAGGKLTIGGAAADKCTSTISFTNSLTYSGTQTFDMKAGTWGQFVGTVTGADAAAALEIKDDCTGSTFTKSALKFPMNRTYNPGDGIVTGYFQGVSTKVGYVESIENAVTVTLGTAIYSSVDGVANADGSNYTTAVASGVTTHTYNRIGYVNNVKAVEAENDDDNRYVYNYLNTYVKASY